MHTPDCTVPSSNIQTISEAWFAKSPPLKTSSATLFRAPPLLSESSTNIASLTRASLVINQPSARSAAVVDPRPDYYTLRNMVNRGWVNIYKIGN